MENLSAAIERFREMTGVPAVWAGTLDRNAKFAAGASGVRSRDSPCEPATIDDQCHIGSCGKSMTSALYARLVEAGVAEWDVPISALFDDVADLDPGWDRPTVDDLLRCRAGVAPNPPMSQMKALFEDPSPLPDQRTRAAVDVLSSPPKNPGTFVYSNLGYIVAGAAIERLTGATFEDAMRTYVTEPLDMKSFGYGPSPQVSAHRPRLQLGPFVIGKGKAVERGGLEGDNPPLFTPAGRYHLTIEDWSRFLALFLHEGGDFLQPDTIARLVKIPADGPRSMGMGWASGKELHGSVAMQGSNTMWSATALFDTDFATAAMVVANDGRTSVLRKSALLAKGLLDGSAPT